MHIQNQPTMSTKAASEGINGGHHYYHRSIFPTQAHSSVQVKSAQADTPSSSTRGSSCSNTETAASEALLALSSVASIACSAAAEPPVRSRLPPPPSAPQRGLPKAPGLRRVSLYSPIAGYSQPQWPQPLVPSHPQQNIVARYATPKRAPSPAVYHARLIVAEDAAPAPKKARTVSPLPAFDCVPASTESPNEDVDSTCASCICPVCNTPIKGLSGHQVDWSQPVQGRQRAKTITSIKKHVKDFHENEPIWNVIVNSLDIPPSRSDGDPQRVVTAQAFVTQALKKAALDQILNQPQHLRSFRWTEKMLDQRVGIAKGFIQFGGQEYLRNKECLDEAGNRINPKSLRNLAYTLLQTMYNDLMTSWTQNDAVIQAAMATAPLGLLRNRFQLLFASPEKWNESWYMDPTKCSMRP